MSDVTSALFQTQPFHRRLSKAALRLKVINLSGGKAGDITVGVSLLERGR